MYFSYIFFAHNLYYYSQEMDPVTQKEKEDKIHIIINNLIHIGKLSEEVRLHNKFETLREITEIWRNGNLFKIEQRKVGRIFNL